MRRSSWAAAAAVPLLLLVSACGPQPGADADPVADVGALDADAVALRVDTTGGFVPAEAVPGRLPGVTVYGDGRVVTEGPVPAIYPGPALPNLVQAQISADDVDLLVQKALDAGVGASPDLGQPGVADATTTRLRVTTAEGTKETQVYALGMNDTDPALSGAQQAARKKLSDFVNALQDLSMTLGSAVDQQPFPVTAIAAIATPYAGEPSAGLPAPQPVAWPGPALPGDKLNAALDVGCVTATGDAATAVVAAAGKANASTPWTSGEKQWSVRFRPLLPDETDCADLAKQS